MGGATPLNHHHTRLLLATISITFLIPQFVLCSLCPHVDASPASFPPFDPSNPHSGPVASEKSTRGISLVDRKFLHRSPGDLPF